MTRSDKNESDTATADDMFADSPTESPLDRMNRSLFLTGTVFTFVVLFVSGIIVALSVGTGREPGQYAEHAAEPTSTKAPTPSPTPDISIYSMSVYNGAGVSGLAGRAATALQNTGFSQVAVGNADRLNYENTQIFIASSVDTSEREWILGRVKSAIGVGTLGEGEPSTSSDIHIIIGRDAGQL